MRTMPGASKVDPSCAVCNANAVHRCGCEANALEVALVQAEDKFIKPAYLDVRSWVRTRARDYILAYFHIISEPVKDAYSMHLDRLTAECMHRYSKPPTRAHLAAAEAEYRKNIDDAWRASVQRYPEVLDYFYSLVHISLPDDKDPAVRTPPLHKLGEMRKASTRKLIGMPSAPTPTFPIPAVVPPTMMMMGQGPPPMRQGPPPPPWNTPPHSPHHGHFWGPGRP